MSQIYFELASIRVFGDFYCTCTYNHVKGTTYETWVKEIYFFTNAVSSFLEVLVKRIWIFILAILEYHRYAPTPPTPDLNKVLKRKKARSVFETGSFRLRVNLAFIMFINLGKI